MPYYLLIQLLHPRFLQHRHSQPSFAGNTGGNHPNHLSRKRWNVGPEHMSWLEHRMMYDVTMSRYLAYCVSEKRCSK